MVQAGKRPRILVVDDDDELLNTMKQLLELRVPGIEVVAVSSGQAALDRLAANGIKLIVTDYRMPGMDGLELTVAAHEAKPDLPVILVTAFTDERLRHEAHKRGVADFLPKPFTVAQFVDAVSGALA